MSYTVTYCRCDRRMDAVAAGDMAFVARHRAWIITDAPLRCMSEAAKYYAMAERREYHHTDHSGEPYLFHECVFCGHTLPSVNEELGMTVTDGSEGDET